MAHFSRIVFPLTASSGIRDKCQYIVLFFAIDYAQQSTAPALKDKKLADNQENSTEELDNRIFFRLYQCANMMHKTGTRAVEAEGITTQQWAVLGALSHPGADAGMSVGELAEFLMVSRQNLSGVVSRLEALGHLRKIKDATDGRSRRICLTEKGEALWQRLTPMIHDYYTDALSGFSFDDRVDLLHRLNGLLGNLKEL